MDLSQVSAQDYYDSLSPRNPDGSPRQRNWWQTAGGALSGIDAFSDINAMRNPAKTEFQAGAGRIDPGRGAYEIGGAYDRYVKAGIDQAWNRKSPTTTAASAQQAQLGPLAQATFDPGKAAQGTQFAQSQAQLASGPGAFGGAEGRGAWIEQTPSDQWRGQQQGLAGALTARAAGQAPSAAELQMRQGLGQAIASQRAQAASARGLSSALANRQAQEGIVNAQAQTNQQAAALRAQEQAQAEQSLGGLLGGARAQDLGVAGQQAQLAQEASLANAGFRQQAGLQGQSLGMQANLQNAQLGTQVGMQNAQNQQQLAMANLANQQQMGLANTQLGAQTGLANMAAANQYGGLAAQLAQQTNLANAGYQQQAGLANQQAQLANQAQIDQATQAYLAMGMSREQAQQQAYGDYYKMLAGQQTAADTTNAQIAIGNTENQNKANAGMIGLAGNVLGGIFKSDERAKTEIDEKAGEKASNDLLEALRAARFTYKDQADGAGPQLGIMAQSAEKSEAGRSFVRDTPDGKVIDATRAVGPLLAALKFTHERLKRLEQKVA
jgi:hypothetical protein